jgi:hypothetical protein
VAEAVVFLQLPVQRFFDAQGAPLAGGKVYSFLSGTGTPKPLYADATGTTPLANPVILPADGRLTAYLLVDEAYRIDVFDANDVHQAGWPVDGIVGVTIAGGGFAPIVAGSTVAGVGSYLSQIGVYVRHGPTVFFVLHLECVGHTGSGNTRILGFPFAAQVAGAVTTMVYGGPGLTLAGPVVGFLRQAVNLEVELHTQDLTGGGLAFIPLADLAAVPQFNVEVSGVYIAA